MPNSESIRIIEHAAITTPAFIFDTKALREDAAAARRAADGIQASLLFALKSFSIAAALKHIAQKVDGFAASSLFEAKLARRVLSEGQSIHLTTPGLRADEIEAICALTDHITFNSIGQWLRFKDIAGKSVKCGLRVNPQLSFVADARYNPCRTHSKLGVPLDQLRALLHDNPEILQGISGLHFHTNCDSPDLTPLSRTIEHLLQHLDPLFDRIDWINLGGGYLFTAPRHFEALQQAREMLQARRHLDLFLEPGASIARRSGFIASSVVDLFASENTHIAVLDTSVNHMPEVFEYQLTPKVAGASAKGEYEYILAGSTCLAGDIFGKYAFDQALEIGSRILFPDMGAYSMVKAHMFNGINLPTLHILEEDGALRQIKRYSFDDFMILCGGL